VIRQELSIFHVPRVAGSFRQLAGGTCVALPKALNIASGSARLGSGLVHGPTPAKAHSKSAQLAVRGQHCGSVVYQMRENWRLYVRDKAFPRRLPVSGDAFGERGAASHIVAVSVTRSALHINLNGRILY
jgi:hypothetical protein